jgi:hypothetical protein
MMTGLIAVSRYRLQGPTCRKTALVLGVLLTVCDTRPVGAWMWSWSDDRGPVRTNPDIRKIALDSFTTPRVSTGGPVAMGPVFNVAGLPDWFYKRYMDFLAWGAREPEARHVFLGLKDGKKLYGSRELAHPTIRAFLDDAASFACDCKVVSYTGDELVLEVRMREAGYVSFIDNWDPDWEAKVDGQPKEILLLFGTFKAVRVPSGESRVIFTYRPRWW